MKDEYRFGHIPGRLTEKLPLNDNAEESASNFFSRYIKANQAAYDKLMAVELNEVTARKTAEVLLDILALSTRNLIKKIKASDPATWTERPEYFRALFTELQGRIKNPTIEEV